MSVTRAILFYSKHNKKGMQMRNTVTSLDTDLETVCVDPPQVKEWLLEDEKYGITRVPTVLIFYSNGHYKTLDKSALDRWFQELLYNIQQYHGNDGQIEQTPLDIELDQQPPSTPQRRSGSTLSRPMAEPSFQEPDPSGIIGSGMIGGGAGHDAAMISEHIRDAAPTTAISSESLAQPQPKEVKQGGPSPQELAKKMQEQREKAEEETEINKPFL
jgi:hypothetical protein